VGLSGKDARLITVEKVTRTRKDPDSEIEKVVDLGFVGQPSRVDPKLLEALIYADEDYIPVVAPIGVSKDGLTYNINADTVAGALASALKAKRMLLLTDVPGVLDANGRLVEMMSVAEARAAIADGTVSGGMIPKIETAIDAVAGRVEGVVIMDGRRPHAMLMELFTAHGSGTLIYDPSAPRSQAAKALERRRSALRAKRAP
jgi:acetylglutamate kinase